MVTPWHYQSTIDTSLHAVVTPWHYQSTIDTSLHAVVTPWHYQSTIDTRLLHGDITLFYVMSSVGDSTVSRRS